MGNDKFRLISKLVRIKNPAIAGKPANLLFGNRNRHKFKVSFILPTKERAQGLIDVLESLGPAMDDMTYEIILYADKIDDEISQIIKNYQIKKVFFDTDLFGKTEIFSWPKLMNHGFAQAEGEWIMFGSDDIVFHPHCFKNALSEYLCRSGKAVGGISFLHKNMVETYDGFFKDYGYDSLNGDKIYINFGLINADAFKQTKGFDQSLKFFWADVDICIQLWQLGFDIIPSHSSLVDHHNLLEAVKKENRTALFMADTNTFGAKWDDTQVFGSRSPLEKVRYVFSKKDSQEIEQSLPRKPYADKKQKNACGRHLVIDGVIFQLQAGCSQGISRVWRNLIPALVRRLPEDSITVLQRNAFEVPIEDVAIHRIPEFLIGDPGMLDQDDELLRKTCQQLKADIFISTYYTRAPGVTNIVMIHDLIPEIFEYDFSQSEWMAKQRSIETADAFITVSKTTQDDLVRYYPQTIQRPKRVAPNGLDERFGPVDRREIDEICNKLKLDKPYLLLVGRRHGYKNGVRLLASLATMSIAKDFVVICVGGETHLCDAEKSLRQKLDLRFVGQISDRKLKALYGGAEALIVPSQCEGFGLPVIEAMACGCPVVAQHSKAVTEVGADAVCYADISSPDDIRRSLATVGDPVQRKQYIAKGVQRAARFNWNRSSERLSALIDELDAKPTILLTAIVSTYNAAEFIQGCLEDLTAQTIADRIEIIVIDSASKQDEAATVKDFQGKHSNIKYIRTPVRENVYKAWNRGIKFALGKYISNANTDDRHRRDAFKQMIDVLETHPEIALVYADVLKTETANETFENCMPTGMYHWYDWDRTVLLEKGCFIGPQPVWRREIHDAYGYFDESYMTSADYEFWLRISQANEFFHISKPLGLYMDRPDSIEHSNTERKYREDSEIMKKYRRAAERGRTIGLKSMDCAEASGDGSDDSRKDNMPRSGAMGVGQSENEVTIQGGSKMYSPDIISNAIECLVDSGHKEAAYWAMDKMLVDFPDNPQIHGRMATKAYEQGDMSRALTCFERAAELAPHHAAAQKNLGDFYYVVQKDADGALAQYAKVLSIEPNNIQSLTMAGHVSISMHRYQDAQQYYQRALALEPTNIEVQEFLEKMNQQISNPSTTPMSVDDIYADAQANIRKGDRAAAIERLEQLLRQDDRHALAHNDLGVLSYETGNIPSAQHHYEQAAALMPENAIFQKNLADFYLVELGDFHKAMEKYVQVLKLDPQDIDALLSCGQICLNLNRQTDAREFFDTVIKIEPWNEDAQQLLRQQDHEMQSVPTSNHMDELYDQAQAMAASGDMTGAISHLENLLIQSPGNAMAHNDLGVLYYETGDKDKALSSYRQAVELDPQAQNYRKNLADFHLFEQGRAEDAMKLYLQILDNNPEDVEALIAVGIVCTTMGKSADAQHFYHRVLEIEPWNETAQNAFRELQENNGDGPNEEINNAAAG